MTKTIRFNHGLLRGRGAGKEMWIREVQITTAGKNALIRFYSFRHLPHETAPIFLEGNRVTLRGLLVDLATNLYDESDDDDE